MQGQDNITEFLMKEAEYIRKAYDERVSQTRALERYALLSTGIVWSWCATNFEFPAVKILVWMPQGNRIWDCLRRGKTG